MMTLEENMDIEDDIIPYRAEDEFEVLRLLSPPLVITQYKLEHWVASQRVQIIQASLFDAVNENT